MIHLSTINELTKLHQTLTKRIGLVPTMGALHDGHKSLIQTSKANGDYVIVSIFINPTQFAPHEDFDEYPRVLNEDLSICEALGVDAVFTPSAEDVYPNGDLVPNYKPKHMLYSIMCGKSRPHFFLGVCNVVERLFNMVQPQFAYFGDKDLQQRVIIQQMVSDLNLGIDIVPCPIVRDENGLALSSRNKYLSDNLYQKALTIPKALNDGKLLAQKNDWSSYQLRQFVAAQLEARGLKGDYVEVFRPSKQVCVNGKIISGDVCCLAAFCGDIRLIDNIKLVY